MSESTDGATRLEAYIDGLDEPWRTKLAELDGLIREVRPGAGP